MSDRRTLRRLERGLAYGMLGWAVEVGFSGVHRALDRDTRDWRLQGHSYLWMLPIYGLVPFLFEPLRDRLRGRPLWQRAAMYAAGFTGIEYASGMALKRLVGVVPWSYSGHGRFVVPGGAVRLDYVPLWAAAGLALEHIDDSIRTLPVLTVRERRA